MANVPAKQRLLALAAIASLAMVSACGSSSSAKGDSSSGSGLPSQITVAVLAEKTGHAGFYGTQLIAGVNAGIAEVKKLGILGNSTIKLDIRDTATDPQTAATLVSDVANTKAVAILGPDVSNEGLTAGPVAQRSKIVQMFGTSAPGIIDPGDYVWSMTTPQDEQMQPIVDDVKKQGFSSVGIIYEEDIASQKEMNTKIQSMFKSAGIKVAVDRWHLWADLRHPAERDLSVRSESDRPQRAPFRRLDTGARRRGGHPGPREQLLAGGRQHRADLLGSALSPLSTCFYDVDLLV